MEIKEIKDKDIWNKFHDENQTHSFLQSWNWGEFNKQMGDKVFHLGIFEQKKLQEKLIGICLAIKVTARRGNFILIPHGPNIWSSDDQILEELTEYLKSLAKKENCSFVRISPILDKSSENEKLFNELGFRKAPLYIHAELLWILDISKTDTELLKGMRKTTRHSIKKAESDGVTVEKSEDISDLEEFNKVYESTFNRQHFVPFSKEYLENEFKAFSADKKISIFFAKYPPTRLDSARLDSARLAKREGETGQNEIVSSAIIVYEKNEAFYHHGASNHMFPKITPSHLLQWEIIKDAKARGCKFYNFWGIAPEGKKNHPMAGLSLFKKGFGGYLEELLPTQDLIINQKYWLNFVVEKVRKLKRGL